MRKRHELALSEREQLKLVAIQKLCDEFLSSFDNDELNNPLLNELDCISASIESLKEKNYIIYCY